MYKATTNLNVAREGQLPLSEGKQVSCASDCPILTALREGSGSTVMKVNPHRVQRFP